MKNQNKTNPLLRALLPIVITILYLLVGFTVDGGWAIGWIMFLFIPIIESLISAIECRDASKFAYPVLLTAIFVFVGMMWGAWHPTWVVYITIPAYYAICDYIKKTKGQGEDAFDGAKDTEEVNKQGNEFSDNGKKDCAKGSKTAIIITLIIAGTVIVCVAIVSAFSYLGGGINVTDIFGHKQTTGEVLEGNGEFSVDKFDSIEINWVNGKVDVSYYEGDTVIVSESNAGSRPMNCSIEDRELIINEFKGSKLSFNVKTKDLSVKIPQDLKLSELEVNTVSADSNINGVSVNMADFETVSGEINAVFKTQPTVIDCESVSGNMHIALPKETTGYSIKKETVSGTVNAESMSFGDFATKIDLESVSGNFNVTVAK